MNHEIIDIFESRQLILVGKIYLYRQINATTGEQTTFAEFKDRSVRCALWLRKQRHLHFDTQSKRRSRALPRYAIRGGNL